jgi:hypothetical protein
MTQINNKNYNPFSKKYFEEVSRRNNNNTNTESQFYNNIVKRYPLTRPDFIEKIRQCFRVLFIYLISAKL